MTRYTVNGIWLDSMQRFSTWIEASGPKQAEEVCLLRYPGLTVCGVIAGCHECADTEEYERAGADSSHC